METNSPTPPEGNSPGGQAAESRRGFMAQGVALASGAVSLTIPAVAGIVTSLNPLGQKGSSGEFHRVASLDLLPEGGPPQKFPIIADRTDAWNRFANEPIGAVFLRRTGPKTVQAFNASCPHAGCAIQYHGDDATDEQKRNRFACPCHTAIFELDGEKIAGMASDSPRKMDRLDVDPEPLQNGEVWVWFKNFETGIADPIART